MPKDLIESCFSLVVVDTPFRAWEAVCDRLNAAGSEYRVVLFEVTIALWRLPAATTIHAFAAHAYVFDMSQMWISPRCRL